MPSGTASEISWAAPAASPSFKSQPGFCTAHPASRHAGSAARPPGAFFSRRYPKKPRLRGVSVACLCVEECRSRCYPVPRGTRRSQRLPPDPRLFSVIPWRRLPSRLLPMMVVRKATLVPTRPGDPARPSRTPHGLYKCDAAHVVNAPHLGSSAPGPSERAVMSAF